MFIGGVDLWISIFFLDFMGIAGGIQVLITLPERLDKYQVILIQKKSKLSTTKPE